MLITFKGRGCDNCPFYHTFQKNGDQWNECIMHEYDKGAGELYMVDGNKPKGCPFTNFYNIEIRAEDN